jgi:CRP-like cAMP-binding protein
VRIGPKGKQVIDTLDRGAVFGEMAFLSEVRRTATVVALSDVEVLVITQKYLRDIMESMPEIACRVLFNLSLVLCERLANSTANLSAGAKAASPAVETARKQQVA